MPKHSILSIAFSNDAETCTGTLTRGPSSFSVTQAGPANATFASEYALAVKTGLAEIIGQDLTTPPFDTRKEIVDGQDILLDEDTCMVTLSTGPYLVVIDFDAAQALIDSISDMFLV